MTQPRSTLFPNGVSNAASSSFWGKAKGRFADPTKFVEFFDDFNEYIAANYTVTEDGVATQVLSNANGAGGVLLITNAAADDNHSFSQLVGEAFQFTVGKEAWFEARFRLNDVTQSDAVVGLQITDTSPLAVSDGVYFLKTDGAATLDLVVIKDSTSTTLAAVATLVDDTYVKVSYYYDGVSTLEVYVDDALVATQTDLTNLPDDELLTMSFGVQNGEAVAKTMAVDYVLACVER